MTSDSGKSVVDRPPPAWLLCFCSVEFDLDLGQQLEHIVPEDALSVQEQSDVSFHAFPDSMSMELHSYSSVRDSLFFFRIKRDRLLYGFVFCRQRQDEKLARGGDQRAVVVVSEYPFSAILRPLVQLVGLEYFNGGTNALNESWEEAKVWGVPNPSKLVQLLLKGHNLVAQLPPFSLFPPPAPPTPSLRSRSSSGVSRTSSSRGTRVKSTLSKTSLSRNSINSPLHPDRPESLVSMFNEFNVLGLFQSVLPKLWGLWELVLTGEPLAVIAPSPGETSSAVAALISLIAPVPYAADFRPYYTIHDATFHELTMAHERFENSGSLEFKLDPHLPRLVGLMNLYFLKAMPSWPNVLSIGEKPALSPGLPGGKAPTLVTGGGGSRFQRFMPRNILQAWRIRGTGPQILLSQHVEYLWMAEDPVVRPNWDLCKKITQMGARGSSQLAQDATSGSELIRKHFAVLTTSFLEPFQRYFVPMEDSTKAAGSSDTSVPGLQILPQFHADEFLESLETWSFSKKITSRIPVHRDLIDLYQRFIDSPNFHVWLARQQFHISKELGSSIGDERELEALLSQPDRKMQKTFKGIETMKSWDCGDEVRLVEEFVKLEEEIVCSDAVTSKILDDFCKVVSSMSSDLRQALLSSPARANLIEKLQSEAKDREDLRQMLPATPCFSAKEEEKVSVY